MDWNLKAAEDLLRRYARDYLLRTKTHGERDARASADRNRFGGALEMAAILLGSVKALDLSDRVERELGETPPRGPAMFELESQPPPRPNVSAKGYIISPDEYLRRGYQPPSNRYHLVIEVKNAGPGVVTRAHAKAVDGNLRPDEPIDPIAVAKTEMGFWPLEQTQPGNYVGLPTTILITYDADGWTQGSLTLKGIGSPPTFRVVSTTEPIPNLRV